MLRNIAGIAGIGWFGLALWLALGSLGALAAPSFLPGPPTVATFQYTYTHISTDATTQIKSGPGIMHTLCVNSPAATETITIYDSLTGSGSIMAVVTLTASTQSCFAYDIAFGTGLTIVTAIAAGDLTVTWL
jgi:hypothetical protein